MKNTILNEEQLEEFESNGFIIISNFIQEETIQSLKGIIDELQGNKQFSKLGRWDLRNCIASHQKFVELMADESLVTMATQILDPNIKLLGSHIVKMSKSKNTDLPVTWHRDGGVLSAELPDPLPLLFVKASFCISGSLNSDSGELLVVPGSHRLIGEPSIDSKTNLPIGVTKILLNPGDLLIFDWRLWHAVNKNSSQIVRRTLYLTFGFRWLAPMDHKIMPNDLLNKSPIHSQLFGNSTELGNYLPLDEDLPLKNLSKEILKTERRCNYNGF